MKQFSYRAKGKGGEVVAGAIWGESIEEARLKLRHQGYYILDIRLMNMNKRWGAKKIWTTKRLIRFSFQMGMLLEAGVSIRTVLCIMDKQGRDIPLQAMLETLDGGSSVHQMLEQVGFPNLACTLIRAGEASGTLGEAFLAVKKHYEKMQQEKEKLVQITAYPIFIGSMMILFFLGTELFILPSFQVVFESLGVRLPMTTTLLFCVSEGLREQGVLVGIIILVLLSGTIGAFRHPFIREHLDTWIWRFMGKFDWFSGIQYSRLFRVLSLLLSSGISIFEALPLVAPLCTNQYVRKRWEKVLPSLAEGKSVSHAFLEVGLATPLITELLQAGEMSGELDAMLQECSNYYEKEVMRGIRRVSQWMEPILMTVLGIGVGTLVLSIMLPLFQAVHQMGTV